MHRAQVRYSLLQYCLFLPKQYFVSSFNARYIEVFKVRRSEMEWAVKKSGEGSAKSDDDSSSSDDEDESRNYVRLRGLPYDCTKSDIERFFEGTGWDFLN